MLTHSYEGGTESQYRATLDAVHPAEVRARRCGRLGRSVGGAGCWVGVR
jgi:hypothetical protein